VIVNLTVLVVLSAHPIRLMQKASGNQNRLVEEIEEVKDFDWRSATEQGDCTLNDSLHLRNCA
jgi:hypothetical protein